MWNIISETAKKITALQMSHFTGMYGLNQTYVALVNKMQSMQ